jgi:ABC-type antimicrobial peptide transport system permease subunit
MVGIIDDRVARSVFGAESPLGKRFRIPYTGQPWVEIVGVVGHVHHDGLSLDPRGQVYWNYLQRAQDRMALVVRTNGDPNAIATSIVSRIHAVNPQQPVSDVRSMNEVVNRSISKQSLTAILAGLFAFTALVLAVVGVYGVMSYVMGQRAREIGIRVALGASRPQILTMVLRDGVVLIGAGLSVGLGGALLAQRTLKSLLFGVNSIDILSFSGAFVLIGSIALLACYIPARRAASADPNLVLRAE